MIFQQNPIVENVHYVGVNDRQKHLFENYLPLPNGVSYNSYLIVDEKVALIDTVDVAFSDLFFRQIEAIIGNRPIDYLIVNHMEPDHAGSIGLLRNKYPDIQIVGNKKTFDFLHGYFHIEEQLHEVGEGDKLTLGNNNLQFFMAPMVHWPEVMVTYLPAQQLLFSADAFGTFGALNGSYRDSELDLTPFWDDMRRYYACIVGKFGTPVQNALKKLSALPLQIVCPTHGPVWQSQLSKVVGLYDSWSKYEATAGVVITYGSMYGNTQQLAEAVAQGVVAGGVHRVIVHDVSKSDASFILSDIFQYQGLIIGSPTYMMGLYPLVHSLLHKIEERGIKNRLYSCFGSYSWAGAACKSLTTFAETMKWSLVGTPVENKQGADSATLQQCFELGKAMAERIINQ